MNMFKKNGGFTLVELIVVIAILAILAGIAIPAYSGYIEKANEAADSTALSAVKTAAMATYATKGEVTEIVVDEAAATVTVTINNDADTTENIATDTDFLTYYGKKPFAITIETGKAATWTKAGGWAITPDE